VVIFKDGFARSVLNFSKEVNVSVHLYLSLVPEALIASMLEPEEFGSYYAVGTKKKSSGQALFLEVDPDFRSKYFRINEGISRCIPHEDGTPKYYHDRIYPIDIHSPAQAICFFSREGKAGLPRDVAKLATFFSCELSDWITGQLMICDGGMII